MYFERKHLRLSIQIILLMEKYLYPNNHKKIFGTFSWTYWSYAVENTVPNRIRFMTKLQDIVRLIQPFVQGEKDQNAIQYVLSLVSFSDKQTKNSSTPPSTPTTTKTPPSTLPRNSSTLLMSENLFHRVWCITYIEDWRILLYYIIRMDTS